jgi:FkbM family methyltransferase
MSIEPRKRPTPKRLGPTFVRRMGPLVKTFRFAWLRGGSFKDCFRLFYHVGIKPSLVFRGWSRYSPGRILAFSVKVMENAACCVYARDNGLEVGTIAEFFSPECSIVPPELPLFKPKVVYDIGANIGIATLRFAAMYPNARFYGFEPLPANFEVCLLNYKALPSAQVFPWALGSRTEVTSFICEADPRGGHLGVAQGEQQPRTSKRIDVQVYSILDLIRVQKLEPPDFLKIDVEGAEVEVLKGLGDAIGSVKRIFVETHGEVLKAECLRRMQESGFQIWPSIDPTALWGYRV